MADAWLNQIDNRLTLKSTLNFLLWIPCVVWYLAGTLFFLSFKRFLLKSAAACLSRWTWQVALQQNLSWESHRKDASQLSNCQLVGPRLRLVENNRHFLWLDSCSPSKWHVVYKSDHCGENEEIVIDIEKLCGRKEWHCRLQPSPISIEIQHL